MSAATARSAVEKAERAHADALAKLEAARAELSRLEESHDATQTPASREALIGAKIDIESAERLVTKRADAAEKARATLDKAEREEMAARLADEKRKLSTWRDALAPHVDRIVREIDLALEDAVLAIAGVIVDHADVGVAAREHAAALGVPLDVAGPTLADARLLVQRALLRTRHAREAEDLSVWLVSASDNFRLDSMSAAELAAHDAEAARAQHATTTARAQVAGALSQAIATATKE